MTFNRYTMTFVFSPDLDKVLLLKKPADHPNVLFRNRWTAPGGRLEYGETHEECARRELKEKTGLVVSGLIHVLLFGCSCDPRESDHAVWVYATRLAVCEMERARGTETEPVRIFATGEVLSGFWSNDTLPLFTLQPLLDMCRIRLTQVPA